MEVLELTAAHWSHQISYKYDIDLQLTVDDVCVMLTLMDAAKLINPEVVPSSTVVSKTKNVNTSLYGKIEIECEAISTQVVCAYPSCSCKPSSEIRLGKVVGVSSQCKNMGTSRLCNYPNCGCSK